VLPALASVGEADITILSHIGLAMMGEGEVIHAGTRKPAAQALRDAALAPLVPFAKDSLAIMSSNAYAAASAVLAVRDVERLLGVSRKVFALSLEALNGNVAPFLEPVHLLRPYAAHGIAAAAVRAELDGSYLWQRSPQRALQDPLSFRTAAHVLGAADEALAAVKARLEVQLNTSDDNPAVIYGLAPPAGASSQVLDYYVQKGTLRGAVIPTANFEPLPWLLPLQSLSVALSHVSRAAAERITRLGTPEFTHLSRFLAPDDVTLAYSAIQKAYAALDAEIQALSVPVSKDSIALAGDIEDTATNTVEAASRLRRIAEDLYFVTGIELMHAAQAIDLRRRADPGLALGSGTGALFAAFRRAVPFLDRDRPLTPDIADAARFLRSVSP
jgi:histidine ammonia-lyase